MDNRILIFCVLIIVVFAAGYIYSTSSNEQGTGEQMVEVKVPVDLDDVAEGKVAFDENCASCHGENASGLDGSGPPLIHKIYEPDHHGDMSFLLAAKNGVRAHHWKFGNMPPVEDIEMVEVKKIVAYVRKLQRANGIN